VAAGAAVGEHRGPIKEEKKETQVKTERKKKTKVKTEKKTTTTTEELSVLSTSSVSKVRTGLKRARRESEGGDNIERLSAIRKKVSDRGLEGISLSFPQSSPTVSGVEARIKEESPEDRDGKTAARAIEID
jgi:flagellar biosynthesis component FlhA